MKIEGRTTAKRIFAFQEHGEAGLKSFHCLLQNLVWPTGIKDWENHKRIKLGHVKAITVGYPAAGSGENY